MIRTLCLTAVLLGGSLAHAQSPRAGGPAPTGPDAAPRLAAEVAIGGNLARGFVDREMITARAIIEAWSGPWGLYIQPYWLYGRVGTPMGKLTTDNEIYERTGLFRTITGPWFVYAVNAYDRSVRRKIDHRDLLGGGAGARLWQCGPSSLLASVGALYEWTDFEELDGVRQTGRFSVRLYGRYKIAGGRLALVHDVIYIPAFRDVADNYRVLMFGAIDAPIAKGFSVRVQADATREGTATIAPGTKQDDLAVTFGLAYKAEWKNDATVKP